MSFGGGDKSAVLVVEVVAVSAVEPRKTILSKMVRTAVVRNSLRKECRGLDIYSLLAKPVRVMRSSASRED